MPSLLKNHVTPKKERWIPRMGRKADLDRQASILHNTAHDLGKKCSTNFDMEAGVAVFTLDGVPVIKGLLKGNDIWIITYNFDYYGDPNKW